MKIYKSAHNLFNFRHLDSLETMKERKKKIIKWQIKWKQNNGVRSKTINIINVERVILKLLFQMQF